MPKVSVDAETKLARKRGVFFGLLVTGIFLIIAGVWTGYNAPYCYALRNGSCYFLEYATTPSEHARGLSGRRGLAPNHAMVFVFQRPTVACFWMKGMKFPIDIIWVNAEHKIAKIVPDLRPDTYPKSYCPDNPADRVLELPAGSAQELGLRTGDSLPLP